jgi:hypothetical protein
MSDTLNVKKPSKKNYFTQETEDAIVKYNNSTDSEEKSKLFQEKIHYAFYKLAENLIHTFKFYYTEVENLEDLKHEIVSMLVEEKINKFDSSRGAKAFSYFGTIVKNWLIVYNDKNYKKKVDKSPIEDINSDESIVNSKILDYNN